MKQMNGCNGPGLWTPSVLLLDLEFIIKHLLFGYGSCVLWFSSYLLKIWVCFTAVTICYLWFYVYVFLSLPLLF